LLERAGVGGMATVYRARDERLKRDVAVKIIAEQLTHHPLFVSSFRREAQLCARLAHPNVVRILDAGEEPRDFIVMEFVDGVNAGTLLKRQGPLTTDHTVRVLARVCDALAHAHDRNVVHHDVTPGNILISRSDGTVKLADFGLASDPTDLASDSKDVHAGRIGDVSGTPGFVAPEILKGATPSPRSDLYSLGVVAHRLLAGPPRIRPADPESTRPRVTAAPHIPPLAEVRPGVPRVLSEAVERALAQDPDARQGSVAEFRAQLIDDRYAPVRDLSSAA
jgi:eukaryotic-like serine/threonine-protein kinase